MVSKVEGIIRMTLATSKVLLPDESCYCELNSKDCFHEMITIKKAFIIKLNIIILGSPNEFWFGLQKAIRQINLYSLF